MLEFENFTFNVFDKGTYTCTGKISSGTIVVLRGASGCGKSTFLLSAAGHAPTLSGDLLLDRLSLLKSPVHQRQIAYKFQEHLLFPHLTVSDNVGFGLRFHPEYKNYSKNLQLELIKAILNDFHLLHKIHSFPEQLSGGEQQRVSLARTLILSPKALFLDEPLSQLDPKLKDELGQYILTFVKKLNIPCLWVSHDSESCFPTCSEIRYKDWPLSDHLLHF